MRWWSRLVEVGVDGSHRDLLSVARPFDRPWRIQVFRVTGHGYLASATRDHGEGTGRFRGRAMDTWWSGDYAATARAAVDQLRCHVRRSMRRQGRQGRQ